MQQQAVFLEGDNAGGGSNDGILLTLHRKESLEYNPVPHFYSVHVKILDELKQCVCSYYHWFVLLFLLSDGIRLSSPVLSVVLIMLAFINLWRGADLYLSHPAVFIRKWRLITVYLLAAISIRIAALFMRAENSLRLQLEVTRGVGGDVTQNVATIKSFPKFLRKYMMIADGLLGHFLIYDKTNSISYMSFHVMLSYFSNSSEDNTSISFLLLFVFSERRYETVNVVIVGTFNAASLIYELIEFNNSIFRGVVLQTQLIYKAMTYHQQQDRRRLAKIKRTIETMTKVNLPLGEWFIECEFYRNHFEQGKIAVQQQEGIILINDNCWMVSECRFIISCFQTPYITISALLSACALWLARKTLGYRYIRFVINEEKRLLLEKLPAELSLVSQDSLSKLEKCNLGNEICLVTSSRDIIKYMNEVHDRWLKLPLLWRLLNAIGTFWVCNTALLCYLIIIVAHGQAACLFTFPLTILVFFWGAISERKRRLLWTIAIFYVQRNGFWYASSRQLLQNEGNKKCCLWSVLLDILRLRQRSPSNYYSWMILSDLFALIILIVNFSNFDLARRSAFTLLESNSSLLPDSFIILDRIIYLKRAIRAKFVYLVVEVIVIHVYILIILFISPQTDENRRMTSGLFIWYVARGIHMLSSAFQVRDGYPKFIVGDTMMKSNPISWALYVGYFYTVPVFEIATILDWTFTSTTLTLLDFYILKTINYYLYFIKGMRKFEAFYPRKRAELTSVSAKMFVGIFLPVQMVFTLRIDKHPILYEYHLEDLPLISDREYNHLIKYFAFDMYAQNFIKSLGAETIVEATLPSRGMIHYVHPDWKAQLMQLVNETTDRLKLKSRIYLRRMRVQEQRDNLLKKTDTTPLETAREWEMEMERQEVQDLSDVLGSTNCSDVFEMDISEIVRPLITVPNGGLMYEYPIIGEEQFIDGFAYFNYTFKYMTKLVFCFALIAITKKRGTDFFDKSPMPEISIFQQAIFDRTNCQPRQSESKTYFANRLILKPDCTENQIPIEGVSIPHVVMFEQYGVGHDGSIIGVAGALRFLFFVYKVSSSYLRLLNISTPSLVMTFAMIYLLSFKLRDILMTKPFELTFRELGDPSRLIRLCSSISIARETKLYDLEHDLYGKLIYILRSSEALIRYTQYKMKNII
ncbi:unnamed protein product [Onchocerca flexuosa]|uniref:Gustatory receptor n=1 Tax=Onchocerca flexuosa TaxID=387005 RepID=A0A183GYL3_9BILA|nr:unnamed protein product [Onchocerca flexuosa]